MMIEGIQGKYAMMPLAWGT